MEILTEWDKLQQAMAKVDLDEEIMPTINGRIVENVDSYNKIQKILETPELINAHKYLYDLDIENLDHEDVQKVDKIYDLGVERGFIQKPDDTLIQQQDVNFDVQQDNSNSSIPTVPYCNRVSYKTKIPSWTVLYSAWKNGNIKTGECYSNSINPQAAKADCYAKLTRCGYDNINILAIEAGDPDYCGQEEYFEADQNVIENDMINGRNHNLHVQEKEDDQQKKQEPAKEEKKEIKENPEVKEQPEEKKDLEIAKDPEDQDSKSADKDDKSEEQPKSNDIEKEQTSDDEEQKSSSNDEVKTAEDKEKKLDTQGKEDTSVDKTSDKQDDSEETKELSDDEKVLLKNDYRKLFKQIMLKCGFEDKCFDDLTIEDKIQFFTELNKSWGKNEPKEFMTDKEIEQQNKIVIKK